MSALQQLAAEFAITVGNADVWLSIGVALLLGGLCLLLGVCVTRLVGLLESDAPAGETVSVGLGAGLMLVAAWWAAIWSGGRSSFTPVAIGFALAIAVAFAQRWRARRSRATRDVPLPTDTIVPKPPPRRWTQGRSLLLTVGAAAGFVVAVALVYGSTLALSPRDGVQPVEKTDVAFYAVLGKGLADSGTEDNTFPSGFSDLPGVPAQAWYHWGELWLASAIITIFGTAPLAARYLVVLPVLLLAAAALTGTLVRRMNGTRSRPAFVFGVVVCLLLAPVPLISGPFFSVWAAGLISGITVFGLAAVAVVFSLYLLAVIGTQTPSWPLTVFAGTALALILPAHIVLALLALVGVGGVGGVWMIRAGKFLLASRRLPPVSPIWRRTVVVTALGLVSTVAWGLLTGHGLGVGAALDRISPFNDSWRDTVAIVTLGAGMLLAIPIAWLVARRDAPTLAALCLGTVILLAVGAFVWGWRLTSFNMFYFFFGGIAVFATPVAAVAVWFLIGRIRASRYPRLAVGIIVLCFLQLELGLVIGLTRIQGHSPDYEPIPVSLLRAIEQLPPDAKLAYACQEFEEISFVNSKLLGIDAHTGRRIIPMCFEADVNGPLLGAEVSTQAPDAGFAPAPQRILYPDATARPSSDAVAAFLLANGIEYIYADADHPNTLVADPIRVAGSGGFELLRIP